LAPRLTRLVEELGEHACRFPGALLFFLGLAHLLGDFSTQAWISCEAENVVYRVFFAPSHQLFTTEPGVGSQDDLGMRPSFPDLPDNALDFLAASGTGIDIRGP